MKLYSAFFLLIILSLQAQSQDIHFFGPRAGIGNINDSKGTGISNGIHSAFGWQFEVPYSGDEITGYGEAGFYLLGAEQGIIYPQFWGYFGVRSTNVGVGIGPTVNPIGVGIGLNPHYIVDLDKLRMPIGVDFSFIHKTTKMQLFIGFNYK